MKVKLLLIIGMIVMLGVVTPVVSAESNISTTNHFDNRFDLIVYGGDPEGVAAALAGARNGLKTLLVMEEGGPGGLMVYGALNFLDLNYDSKGQSVNQGIFAEWHRMQGEKVIVDTHQAQLAFCRLLLQEENLTLVTKTRLREVNSKETGGISSLRFETTGISKTHDRDLAQIVDESIDPIWNEAASQVKSRAKMWELKAGTIWEVVGQRYIDATQDADLAAMAGVPYFFGGADVGVPDRKMAVTLVFHLKNIDWKELERDIDSNKWGYSYMNSMAAWGLGKIGSEYQPVNENTKLRGLNIALQEDNSVYINALQIFDLDVLDPESLYAGMELGKAETPHIVQYLRENLAGFSQAELAKYPPQLYVRESRHILALYQLDVLDLLENVDFPDKIALASYPIDYQATSPVDGGFVVFNPGVYSIPFRSLVPRQVDNLLVVGRSAGYSSLAAGSARVIPTGMATAEAAGVAARLSIDKEMNFHQLANDEFLIRELQNSLTEQGVDLRPIQEVNPIVLEPIYPQIKELLSWGMIVAGYNNDLNLDQVVKEREFAFVLMRGLRLREVAHYDDYLAGGLYSLTKYQPMNRDKACELLLAAADYWVAKIDDHYQQALEDGFIPEMLIEGFEENRLLTRRDMYLLTQHFLQRYPIPEKLLELRTRPFGQ